MLFDSDCSSSNMHGLSRDVKMLAALRDEEHSGNGRSLLDAARKMTGALSDLLNAAQPDSKEPRTALLGAATKVMQIVQPFNMLYFKIHYISN